MTDTNTETHFRLGRGCFRACWKIYLLAPALLLALSYPYAISSLALKGIQVAKSEEKSILIQSLCAFCWADANSQTLSPLLRSGRAARLRIALRIELEMHTAYFSAWREAGKRAWGF